MSTHYNEKNGVINVRPSSSSLNTHNQIQNKKNSNDENNENETNNTGNTLEMVQTSALEKEKENPQRANNSVAPLNNTFNINVPMSNENSSSSSNNTSATNTKKNAFINNNGSTHLSNSDIYPLVQKFYRDGDRVLRTFKGNTQADAYLNFENHTPNLKQVNWINNDNTVITSKYTLITFLPKNLFEQFLNLANLYFLMVGILQCFTQISTTNGNPTMYQPLAFILLVSAIRAAREDIDKHNADDKRNSFLYDVLTPEGFVPTKAGSLHAGVIVKVKQNDMVPVDMLFLGGQLPKGHCFIDKSNLNGETTLEVLNSIPATRPYTVQEKDLLSLDVTLIYEPPNKRFDSIRGMMLLGGEKVQEIPIDGKCLVMRETNLRNCEYIYGLAVYTGQDTKIQRSNSEGVKAKVKISKVMRKINRYLVVMLFFQIALCLISAIISSTSLNYNNWYLRQTDSAAIVGVEAFFSWFILLCQMVPISLIVSAEMVKFIQSRFIEWDIALYEPRINKPTHCNNNTIHEDLGLVDYIFSDKTGTLTQNKMEFRYLLLSGDGGEYGSRETEIAKSVKTRQAELDARLKAKANGEVLAPVQPVPWSTLLKPHLPPRTERDEKAENNYCCVRNCDWFMRLCWNAVPNPTLEDDTENERPAVTNTFTAAEKEILLKALWGPPALGEPPHKHKSRQAKLRLYLTHMALSNTVKPYDDNGVLKFQAESAEELAMVTFARSCGFTKLSINPTRLEIREYDETLTRSKDVISTYNHVATMGFTSKRARVTVVYESVEDHRIFVMMKGQDTVMLPLIKLGHGVNEVDLLNNLKNMATNGLRTLVCSHADLPGEWWSSRSAKYNQIISMDPSPKNEGHPDKCAKADGGCEKCVQHAYFEKLEVESQMTYLGCIGMEDQLQPLVPECIADCLRAGIRVWMITGDKLETAKNIGLACNLIDPDMTPHFGPSPNVNDIVKGFQNARLLEITGQWAGLADDREEMGKLFDVMAAESGTSSRNNNNNLSSPTHSFSQISPSPPPPPVPSEIPINDLTFLLKSLRLCVDPDTLPGLIRQSTNTSNSKPSNSSTITREEFIQLMQSAKITKYDAVRHDVDEALNTYNSIADKETYPVSILVDRTAFQVFFPGKPAAAVDSKRKSVIAVPPPPSNVGSVKGSGPSEQELEELRSKFFALAGKSKSVVFARAEPAMKKRMVTEIQTRVPGSLTLAIGDGANDTDMITAAHVGIGIAGVEGTAATNSADYAIGTFRMLHTLLFVHGFFSYHRITKLVYIIFYKASLLAVTMFLFGIFSSFSGQQFFNDPPYQVYNVIYTALPIIVLAIFDKQLPHRILSDYPILYREAKGKAFTGPKFVGWIFRAFAHTIAHFFITYSAQAVINVTSQSGRTDGLWYWSMTVYYVTVLTPTLIVFAEMVTVNSLLWLAVGLSVAALYLVTYIMSLLTTIVPDLNGIIGPQMYASPNFWLTCIMASGVPLIAETIFRTSRRMFFPTLNMLFEELITLPKDQMKQGGAKLVQYYSTLPQSAENEKSNKLGNGELLMGETKVTQGAASSSSSDSESHAHLRGKMIKTMLRFRNLTGSQFDSAAQANLQSHDASSPVNLASPTAVVVQANTQGIPNNGLGLGSVNNNLSITSTHTNTTPLAPHLHNSSSSNNNNNMNHKNSLSQQNDNQINPTNLMTANNGVSQMANNDMYNLMMYNQLPVQSGSGVVGIPNSSNPQFTFRYNNEERDKISNT